MGACAQTMATRSDRSFIVRIARRARGRTVWTTTTRKKSCDVSERDRHALPRQARAIPGAR